jgi:type IV secretion system protein VirD4
MSARLSIMMVKNSPSFELTKIRHYLDKPYRSYYERAKGSPQQLPRLRAWQDEPLQGAINPAPEPQERAEFATPPPAVQHHKSSPRHAQSKPTAKTRSAPQDAALTLTLTPRRAPSPPAEPKRKALSLGADPSPPPGESCDVRKILAAATAEQDAGFNAMIGELREKSSPNVRQAVETLDALHRSFGDDKR